MITLELVSALKRNDRIAITLGILKAFGYEERAEELKDSTRATSAFFDRAFAGIKEGDEPKLTYADDAIEAAEKVNEVEKVIQKMKKLVGKGKVKKAKKLAKESGLGGTEIEKILNGGA